MSKPIVEIWTDGSCSIKDGFGGWGAVIIINNIEMEISGSAKGTTNNRMELTAVYRALKLVTTPADIQVFTDSQYVMNGIKNNGWVDRGRHIKNYDIWVAMNKVINHHLNIRPVWVKGHSGIEYNERADTLAGNARLKLLRRFGG